VRVTEIAEGIQREDVRGRVMNVEVTAGDPYGTGPDLVAAAAGARASELGAPERAVADADPVAMVYTAAIPLAVVALEPDVDGLRTGAARAVRACRNGGTVAWALDASPKAPSSAATTPVAGEAASNRAASSAS
jgi:hypothetical protein